MANKNIIKRADISEIRKNGYIQEANRLFFHPLGLAIEVVVDDTGNEYLGGIWDYREDPEGIYFDLKNSSDDRKERFRRNAEFIQSEFDKRRDKRRELFNNNGGKDNIEPIPLEGDEYE